MRSIFVTNKTPREMVLVLEPWTESYKIAPAQQVELRGDFDDQDFDLSVVADGNNYISIYTPDGTTVLYRGQTLEPYYP